MKNWWWLISLSIISASCGSGTRSTPAAQTNDLIKASSGPVSTSGPAAGGMKTDSAEGQPLRDSTKPAPHIMPDHPAPNQSAIDSVKMEKMKTKNKK